MAIADPGFHPEKSQRLDPSLRFFDYVMRQPGMATYLDPKGKKTVSPKRVCQFGCITAGEFTKSIEETYVGGEAPLEQEYNVMPPRKLLLPQFTEEDITRISSALENPDVAYVIFPCLWEEYYPEDCKLAKGQRHHHMVLLALNKATTVLELWDDLYAKTQVAMSYDYTATQPLYFMRPFLKTFGYEIADTIEIPMFDSEKHGMIKALLERPTPAGNSSSPKKPTFHEIYMSFMANYIRKRGEEHAKIVRSVKKANTQGKAKKGKKLTARIYEALEAKTKSAKAIANTLVPKLKSRVNKYLDTYDALRRHNDLWPRSNANAFVYHNPHMPLPAPCETGQVRDVQTNECQSLPKASLPIARFENGKRVRKSNLMSYFYYICMYFAQKHPAAAIIVPPHKTYPADDDYCIMYVYDPEKAGRNRFDIGTPPSWDKFLAAAMANDSIRFIVMPVLMRARHGKGHVNTLVADKHKRTIERYEPNTGPKEDTRWGNGRIFDHAFEEFFARPNFTPKRPTKKQPTVANPFAGYKYSGAEETCPRGLHRYEFHENTTNVFDAGGNCAIWSVFLADLRLSNPDVPSGTLADYAAQEISKTGSFKHFIDAYADYIVRAGKVARKQAKKA